MGIEEKFIHHLLDNKICTNDDIKKAKEVQKKYHTKIANILLNLGVTTEKLILREMSIFFNIPLVTNEQVEEINISTKIISKELVETYGVFPFHMADSNIHVALDVSFNYSSVFKLSNILKSETTPFLASSDQIAKIKKFYEPTMDNEDLLDLDEDEEVEKLKELASEAPVIKKINSHFNKAVEQKASDIHYETFKNGMYVRTRVDGVLHTIDTIEHIYKRAVIARLKLLSKMNISETRLPQDGRISIKVANNNIDIRSSSVPTAFGESFVLRLLGKQTISYSLNALEFYDDHLKLLREIASKPNGIFLTTGPTGSGKTTTLYSLLNEVNSEDVKIITVEDPVEYELSGINQIQVKSQIGFSFANALRSILRQDPDIIMVGEIRDEETARISIQASLTGHIVLSTLHTNSALGAITRLVDMNVEYFLLKSSINGLMAQRLVRRLCPHCKERYEIDSNIVSSLHINSLLDKYPFVKNEPYRPGKCEKCNFTGYAGRVPVAEILLFDKEVQDVMESNKNFNDLNSLGYRTLSEDAILKFLDGITSYEEVIKVS